MDEGLSNMDAQRLFSILNEVEQKIQLATMLPETLDRKITTLFSLDTISLLTQWKQLQTEYEQEKEAKQKTVFAQKLKKQTKQVHKHFYSNQAALTKLSQYNQKPEDSAEMFLVYISQFKRIVYDKLKISVDQEQKKQEALEQITATEKKMREEILNKKQELITLKKSRDTMNETKTELISKLKEELRAIRKNAEDANKKVEMKSLQKEALENGTSFAMIEELKVDLKKSQTIYADLVAKNREEEFQFRRKKANMENEVENWILKYDTDLGEKQAELDELQLIYNDEHVQLEELRTRFQILKVQEEKILEEKNAEEAIRKVKEQEAKMIHDAVAKIQALFRGWSTRRKLKKAKEKTGKKDPKKDAKKEVKKAKK